MSFNEYAILVGSALLLLAVLASQASARLGIPALVFYLVVGMLAGSDGPGAVYGPEAVVWFDNPDLARDLGVLALVAILFSGGLSTEWSAVRPVLASGVVLATLGVAVSALVVGGAVHLVIGFEWKEALLLGAIVSSTDAAAVFSVMRTPGAAPKQSLGALLELESGGNDPMAVFLSTMLLQMILEPTLSTGSFALMFVWQMSVGTAAGLLLGRGVGMILDRVRLQVEELYPTLSIGLIFFIFALTDLVGGNGFLAVYLAGIVIGSRRTDRMEHLTRFHDALAGLMEIIMFLALGLFVFPHQLPPVMGEGLVACAILMFLARPISVFVCLGASRWSLRDKVWLSWGGLRGAVPIILATFPLADEEVFPAAREIFNVVFFIVFASVVLQGTTIGRVAGWLRIRADE